MDFANDANFFECVSSSINSSFSILSEILLGFVSITIAESRLGSRDLLRAVVTGRNLTERGVYETAVLGRMTYRVKYCRDRVWEMSFSELELEFEPSFGFLIESLLFCLLDIF